MDPGGAGNSNDFSPMMFLEIRPNEGSTVVSGLIETVAREVDHKTLAN